MRENELKELLKYYHGESKVPEDFSPVQSLWWEGEKLLSEKVSRSAGFFNKLREQLRDAIKQKAVSGILADESKSEDERCIILFLDLWHGRYFPYDSLDIINEY